MLALVEFRSAICRGAAGVLAVAVSLAGPGVHAQTATTAAALRVTGPIASTTVGDASRDHPFYAAAADLQTRGYLEQEFFIEGAANRYEITPLQTARVKDGGHRFATRIVVRRPAAAGRFNGTVVVEWNNVTAGRDLDIDWFQTHEHLMRSGYAWAGVTPQRVGVEALKVWNAKRYGALDISYQDGAAGEDRDALSYDVFAAAGRAIRTPGPVSVMGDLRIERIFATGHSQSAGRLATYVNSIHPLAPVFDAVIVHGGGGRIRTELSVPVW
jgi:hypothetical protein